MNLVTVKTLLAKLKKQPAGPDWRQIRDELIAKDTSPASALVGSLAQPAATTVAAEAPAAAPPLEVLPEDVKVGDTVSADGALGFVQGLVVGVFPDAGQVSIRHLDEVKTEDGTVYPEGTERTYPMSSVTVDDTAGSDFMAQVDQLLQQRDPAAAAAVLAEHGDYELAAKAWGAADIIAKSMKPGSLVKDAMARPTVAARSHPLPAAHTAKAEPAAKERGEQELTTAFGDVLRDRQKQLQGRQFALPARPFPTLRDEEKK
jgi:hypothetical protein